MSDTVSPAVLAVERVAVSALRPHPRNYRSHPEVQLEHIRRSMQEHGVYRNVVVARDNTILAGHGVVEAAKSLGVEMLSVVRLDVDPEDPGALRVLTGDNEVMNLSEINDRLLSEVLKDITEEGGNNPLLGTGFDPQKLAALVYVSRPASEVQDFDEAAEWVGMPEFERQPLPIQLIVAFRNPEDRVKFLAHIGVELGSKQKSTWWPPKAKEDLVDKRYEVEEPDPQLTVTTGGEVSGEV